ncbi:MAG: hypothetical protein WCK02_07050 [Bacteroidota bacterium]
MKIFLYLFVIIVICSIMSCKLSKGYLSENSLIKKSSQIEKQEYSKYTGIITVDTIESMTFIQFDNSRVYLYIPKTKYKNIFATGLVSSQMIYCKISSNCEQFKSEEDGDTTIWGWDGPFIFIPMFDELAGTSTKRIYKFMVPRYSGGYFFILELTNLKATKKTSYEDFIYGAKVSYFEISEIFI